MKKVFSFALATSMLFGLASVQAAEEGTTSIFSYDFNEIDAGKVDSTTVLTGVTLPSESAADMEILDLTSDEKYSSFGKVLSWKAKGNDSLKFSMKDYELNENEKLIVEYDFKVVTEVPTDTFRTSKWGSNGLFNSELRIGGGGYAWKITNQSNNILLNYFLGSSKDNQTYSAGSPLDWQSVKIEYDYSEYVKDSSSDNVINIIVKDLFKDETVTKNSAITDPTKFGDLTFSGSTNNGTVYLDNIKAYTVTKFKMTDSTIADGTDDVFYDTKTVTSTFSTEIANADTVTVSKNGTAMDSSEYTVSSDGKQIIVTFANDIGFSNQYTVSYSGITDVFGQTLENSTLSFTTEPEPDVRLMSLKLGKGIGNNFDNTLTGFSAADGLQSISLELKNTKNSAKNVNVLFAVYEGEGRVLTSLKQVAAEVPALQTRTVSVGVNMNDMQGKIVKAFVWDDFSSMKPWFGSLEYEIK